MVILQIAYILITSWLVIFMMSAGFGKGAVGESWKVVTLVATGVWLFLLVLIGLVLGGVALFGG